MGIFHYVDGYYHILPKIVITNMPTPSKAVGRIGVVGANCGIEGSLSFAIVLALRQIGLLVAALDGRNFEDKGTTFSRVNNSGSSTMDNTMSVQFVTSLLAPPATKQLPPRVSPQERFMCSFSLHECAQPQIVQGVNHFHCLLPISCNCLRATHHFIALLFIFYSIILSTSQSKPHHQYHHKRN